MPQYWLKPFGTARPRRPMPDRWTERFELDPFPLMSGPSDAHTPPQMARGDLVLFHAVLYARLFAAGEVVEDPQFTTDSRWAPRWPWLYECRVDVWVPRISDGPRTMPIVPRRAMGRIQRGSQYAQLSAGEFRPAIAALEASPTLERRRRQARPG